MGWVVGLFLQCPVGASPSYDAGEGTLVGVGAVVVLTSGVASVTSRAVVIMMEIMGRVVVMVGM